MPKPYKNQKNTGKSGIDKVTKSIQMVKDWSLKRGMIEKEISPPPKNTKTALKLRFSHETPYRNFIMCYFPERSDHLILEAKFVFNKKMTPFYLKTAIEHKRSFRRESIKFITTQNLSFIFNLSEKPPQFIAVRDQIFFEDLKKPFFIKSFQKIGQCIIHLQLLFEEFILEPSGLMKDNVSLDSDPNSLYS